MTDRILDLSESPARLSAENGNLVIERGEEPPVKVPFKELTAVVCAHPQIRISLAVLAELAANGVLLVACGRDRNPAAMSLPLKHHFLQAERYAAQAAARKALRKRLWKQLVRAKVKAQHCLLDETGAQTGLLALVPAVASGDAKNIEAQASRRYWPALFGPEFRRVRDAGGINALLNYGYAVLRAMVTRAICGAGLNPTLGLHHKNRYNPFCLADDLMEPFRPIVDRAVWTWCRQRGLPPELGPDSKRMLLEPLIARYACQGESRTLFNWLALASASLADVFEGHADTLRLPEFQANTP